MGRARQPVHAAIAPQALRPCEEQPALPPNATSPWRLWTRRRSHHAHLTTLWCGAQVKEIGSHTELLAKPGGLYSELWHKQLTTHDGVEVGAAGSSKAGVPALPVSTISASASASSLASSTRDPSASGAAEQEGKGGKKQGKKGGLFGFGGGGKK